MTVEYTKQWVRITDTLRPMLYIGSSTILALLAFVVLMFTGAQLALALLVGALVFAIASLISLLIIRMRKDMAVNLGGRQLRLHRRVYDFRDIETVSSTPQRLVLHTKDGEELRVPVFWVSKDHLRVLDRMLRMLDNEKVRTGALTIIQDQFLDLSR